jgi:organic radical activating enzyme
VWSLEPTHGCNLRCAHCNCRLDPLPKTYHFMDEATWTAAWKVVAALSPTRRADLCVGGEPTLNEDLPLFLAIARKLSPLTQIQITTNGTMLAKGKVTYRQLFEAGVNIVYTDMYAPREKFIALAKESGYPWYEYYDAPEGAPSPWSYHGPALKMIVLQEQPENWPASRLRAGLLGTWYNHLDWEAAKRFGLSPVTKPLTRRCNQPFLYVTIDSRGRYLLCCQDNTGESAGQFGSVHDGVPGFKRFWYGEKMQTIRARLRQKNRAGTTYCSRCCITFSRCDFKHWTDNEVGIWWDGGAWRDLGSERGLLAPEG